MEMLANVTITSLWRAYSEAGVTTWYQ